MNIKVILNPMAGKGRALRIWQQTGRLLEKLGKDRFAWSHINSQGPEHTRDLSAQAGSENYDAVMVIGGDGTVGDAARGSMAHTLPLIIVPAGTGNACARSLGLTSSRESIRRLLLGNHVVELDGGMIGSSFFINMAGIGFDADVLYRYQKAGWARGIPGYIGVGLQMLPRYRPSPVHLTWEGHSESHDAVMVAVCNGAYYGGGLHMAPDASMQDGLLDVCVIGALTPPELISVWRMLYSGSHVQHPKVRLFRTDRFWVESEQSLKCHRDGDLAGSTPCQVHALPKAIRVMVPKR